MLLIVTLEPNLGESGEIPTKLELVMLCSGCLSYSAEATMRTRSDQIASSLRLARGAER
jgi:hypothetical protein